MIPGRLIDEEIPRAPGEPSIHDYKVKSLRLTWLQSPSDRTIYSDQDGSVQQHSDDNSSPVTYIIEFRSSRSYAWSLYATNVHALAIDVDHLLPGLIYTFRIRAENSNGCSDASTVVSTKQFSSDDNEDQQQQQQAPPAAVSSVKPSAAGTGRVSLNPTCPVISAPSKDIRYYIEGQTAEVIIPVYGTPVPKVKWLRNGGELRSHGVADEKYKVYRDRVCSEHLDIYAPSERDEGAYEIVAENEYGRAVHEFYLQQADPPIFLEPFKDVTVRNGETLTLVCKVRF